MAHHNHFVHLNYAHLSHVKLWLQKVSRTSLKYTLFYKKLRSGPSTESFLAFGDLEYSKFLNSFLTIFLK